MAKSPSGGGASGTQSPGLHLDSDAAQALKDLTQSIETANRNARSAGLIGAQRVVNQGTGKLPADVLQLVVAAATTAAARAPGGGAGQTAQAERAARDAVESYARVLSVRSAGERHGAGLVGAAREAVEAAARQAGAKVWGGSTQEVDRAANRAAEKTAQAYTSGLVAAQEKLHGQAGTLNKLGLHGLAGSVSQVGQFGAGLSELGMTGAGALVSRAALPLAIGMQVAGAVKAIAAVMHDEYLTQGQRDRALFKGIVPGGESIVDWYDTVSGRKRDMARADEEGHRGDIRTQWEIDTQRLNLKYGAMKESAHIRADELAKASPTLMPYIDRSTAAGRQQYELESRLVPVRKKLADATTESAIAAREVTAAQKRENELISQGVKLKQEQAEIQRKLASSPTEDGGPAEGPERQRLLHQMMQSHHKIKANIQDQEGAIEETRQTKNRKARADAEKTRAVANESRAMSEWHGSQADIAEGSARRLGFMSQAARAVSMSALLALQSNPGLAQQDSYYVREASKLAPIATGITATQQGKETQEYKILTKMGLPDFPGDPEDLRKKATEEGNNATKMEFKAEQELANAMEKTIVEAMKKTLSLTAKKLEEMNNEYKTQLQMIRSNT